MKKYKFLRISKYKKLRYIANNYKKNLYIVFLPGFASDIDGDKPKKFLKFAIQNKLGFLALEYFGHGRSSGEFTRGNISKWSNDARITIKKIVKNNDFVLIGSSMGGWISMLMYRYFNNQIKGFLGIGSAPEFLTRIMWKKFPKKTRDEILRKGIAKIQNGEYEYLITKQLILDGRRTKNMVLNKKIYNIIPVTMVHGQKDEVVPVKYSRMVLKNFPKAKRKLTIIKNGDHSLSSKKNLNIICRELKEIIKEIN
jgi:pimeloyl-ACP methyl ester carboxylesterase